MAISVSYLDREPERAAGIIRRQCCPMRLLAYSFRECHCNQKKRQNSITISIRIYALFLTVLFVSREEISSGPFHVKKGRRGAGLFVFAGAAINCRNDSRRRSRGSSRSAD